MLHPVRPVGVDILALGFEDCFGSKVSDHEMDVISEQQIRVGEPCNV
jgi:hypothetical protein